MIEKEVVVRNRAGIHARPAASIVKTANQFSCELRFRNENDEINAKSIMGIITLAAGYKTKLTIIAEGDDEVEAAEAVFQLFESKFEED